MSVRIAALTAALLALASVSSAQTAGPVFTASQSRACVPQENRRAKKQSELAEIQARAYRIQGAIAALEEGILLQQNIEGQGQLHAALGGTAGLARVTKAMSDTFLNLTQDYSPAAGVVKKTYDAFDALVSAGAGAFAGDGVKTTAQGLDTVQKGTEAYIGYLRLQDGHVILPQTPETPKRVAAAVRMADDLRRGDLTGTASKFSAEVETMLDKNSKKTRLALRAGSKAMAGLADTPGKTLDSRAADGLNALGDVSKLVANAAHTRGAGDLAALFGRSGRLLDTSGMMLEQVSRTKQGLGEAADMYREYKKIQERSTKAQAQFQRQIDKKSDEIARLESDAQRIVGEIREAELDILSCRAAEETTLAKSSNRPSAPSRGSSHERLDRTSWRTGSPYAGSSWDRQASRERRDHTMALRDLADRRARTSRPAGGYSSSGPNYGIPAGRSAPKTPAPRPSEPSSPERTCDLSGESGTVIAEDGRLIHYGPACGSQ
jgi:hypothetical protein